MSPLAFDTHRAVKALCEAGAAEPPAEAFMETMATLSVTTSPPKPRLPEGGGESRLPTFRPNLKANIGLVRAGIGGLDARLYRQLWLMAAGIIGLTVALVKLLG